MHPVCWTYQPLVSSTFLSEQISQYFSLRTNQHQPATSQTNRLMLRSVSAFSVVLAPFLDLVVLACLDPLMPVPNGLAGQLNFSPQITTTLFLYASVRCGMDGIVVPTSL
jgi:hypothetical protein